MSSSTTEELDPNLTPLLDLVLQLIMFFMITIRLVHYDQSNEEINLPHAQLSMPGEDESKKSKYPVWVNIDHNGTIIGLGDPLAIPAKELSVDPVAYKNQLEDVRKRIEKHFKQTKIDFDRRASIMGLKDYKIGIVIRADNRCRYEHVWTIMDVVQKETIYDFWQVSFLNVGG